MSLSFPPDFIWGTATASYQIEGAVFEDGRGVSIWDTFCRKPGKIMDGHTGNIACDHYHRYKEDVGLMGELGISSYRFSVSWPRIFPKGGGRLNRKGLDFYKRLIEALLKKDIIPALTLYHWDLPEALQDKGGWLNRETAYYFQEYAACLFKELSDGVPLWITHNEPWCTSYLGHGLGEHAPGLTDIGKALQVSHHLLYSHGLAVKAFRELGVKGQIGITLNMSPFLAISEKGEDEEAKVRADGLINRWFLDPIFKGEYPKDILQLLADKHLSKGIDAKDLSIINTGIDFLGINYYFRQIVGYGSLEEYFHIKTYEGPGPVTEMGWEIHPSSLYDLLIRINQDYGPIPLYITENGAAFSDKLEGKKVHDTNRIDFFKGHFQEAARAIEDGVPLKGYYLWTLMDNFEWAYGYNRRFGLIYVDFKSQERIWKDSALWFREFLGGRE